MPQFLIAAVNYLAVAGAVSVGTAVTIGTFIANFGGAVMLLGGLALSASQAARAKRKAKDAYNASQVDRLSNIVTTIGPRELVMGRVRKGGTVFFKGSTGTNKATYVMCIAIAGHEIDAVETIYLNDLPVTLDGSGNVTSAPYALPYRVSGIHAAGLTGIVTLPHTPIAGSVHATTGTTAGPEGDIAEQAVSVSGDTVTTAPGASITYQYTAYTYAANIRAMLGSPSQAADARLQTLFPGQWTAAHRARGVAYLICEFQYNETAFPSGLPSVTAVVRGAKLYDPRTTGTVWGENPALMMRHVYAHPQFGKGAPTAAEGTRIAAAANACDTSHGYVVAGVTDTKPLYRSAIVAPFGGSAKDLFDDLSQAMAGSWAFAGGALFVKPGAWTASVMSLTESDLAVVVRTGSQEDQQPIAISVHRERAQKFNVVTPQIWDPEQDYKQVTLTPVKGAALIARDGAEVVQPVAMTAVNFAPQAQHVAGVLMRDARDPLTITLPFKLKAYPLELFDTVSLTIPRYGWSAKTFQILAREWGADGALMLTLKESAAAIYTPDAAFLAQGYASNTNLANAWYVPDVGVLSITSGTAELLKQADGTILTRMRVTWPAVVDSSVTEGGTIEVQYRDALSSGAWGRVEVSGSETQALIPGVQDGAYYVVRARARNRVAVGIWSVQVAHQVIGKTAPPPDVASFVVDGNRLSWPAVDAVDLAGYEIRFNYGSNTWWGSAAKLQQGLITSSPYIMSQRPAGLVTLMLRAVDTSGNYSASSAVIVVNLGDQILENLFLSWPQAPTFSAGVIVGGSVVSGAVRATATDQFYGPGLEPFYGSDFDTFYATGTYMDMSYSWGVDLHDHGTLLLAHSVAASNLTIEYLRDSQAEFYGGDMDFFYGPSGDPFFGDTLPWSVWPGSLVISSSERITFRISTAGGVTQGVISVATPQLDVPDVIERMEDIVIAPGGTRLPITKTYRAIVNVSLTTQDDGNGGITARIQDKSETMGPLVYVLNAAGTPVAGLIDSTIQGF